MAGIRILRGPVLVYLLISVVLIGGCSSKVRNCTPKSCQYTAQATRPVDYMIKQFVTNTAEEFQKRGYVVRTVKYVPNDADNLRIDYGNESLAIRRPSSEVLSRDEYNNRLKELTKSLDLLHDQGFSPTAIYFEAGGSNVVLSENGQYLYIGNSDVEQLNSWLGR